MSDGRWRMGERQAVALGAGCWRWGVGRAIGACRATVAGLRIRVQLTARDGLPAPAAD